MLRIIEWRSSTAWPNGFKPVPLPIDGEGLTVNGMRDLLENWDPSQHDGMRRYASFSILHLNRILTRKENETNRPRILYTVPVCQNPTGVTMTLGRKREIYELAVKYDIIIVEDDRSSLSPSLPYSINSN